MGIYLAIDTTTSACSAALSVNGEVLSRIEPKSNKHTDFLLPMIDELFNQAELTAFDLSGIVLSAGPGAFTGLRIGASCALGIANAVDCPIMPISSLALMASALWQKQIFGKAIVSLDARMNEVYAGYYEITEKEIIRLDNDGLFAIDNLPNNWEKEIIVGNGIVYPELRRQAKMLYFDLLLESKAGFYWVDSQQNYFNWQSSYQSLELFYLRNNITSKKAT